MRKREILRKLLLRWGYGVPHETVKGPCDRQVSRKEQVEFVCHDQCPMS
jgi:hypothetical protein